MGRGDSGLALIVSTRLFNHAYFEDGLYQPGPLTVSLTTMEIAEAAMREIVQLDLSASPFDIFMTDLLDPHTSSFRWIAQLGQIRETRTALSGLFGRFVARAYLTRYAGFHHFEPIRGDLSALNAWPDLSLHRDGVGDLPDWIVSTASGSGTVAVAEAKGSHNASGPRAALDKAREQARRVKIMAGADELEVKRFAIATRWAVAGDPKLQRPYLWVDDPTDGERRATPKEQAAMQRGVGLGHFAALAQGLGYGHSAELLNRAKADQPGGLDFDSADLAVVDDEDGSRLMMVAAITRSGVVRLPPDATEDFQVGLISVFGDQALLMAVDVESALAVDRMEFAGTDLKQAPQRAGEADFWSARRARPDGVEILPLDAVKLRGRGIRVDLIDPEST